MRLLEAQEGILRREMDIGRGGREVLPFPVSLEPPFTPFHHPSSGKLKGHSLTPPPPVKVRVPPLSALTFLDIKLSPEDSYILDAREQLPLALGSRYPVAFEVVSLEGSVSLQFVAAKPDAPSVAGQLQAHYPEAQVIEVADLVASNGASFSVARSYRLRDSHLFQIRSEHRPESYTALIGILASLRAGEAGLFQVLFYSVRHPWQENVIRVASDPWDPSKSAFIDLPDLPRKARAKIERPLFAVTVRLAASGPEVLAGLERSFLSQFQSVENGLAAIAPDYPLQSIVGRFSQTPGMLLNARELAALMHLPDPDVVPGAPVAKEREAPAPPAAKQDILIPLGLNRYRGVETSVGIPASWLPMHVAIFGVPGSGKSNLLTWFLSVVEAGYGLAFLDPAGDTAEWFLKLIPERRVKDVIYFNPGLREYPPALNVLEASDQREKEMLMVELLVSLKRLFHRSGELTPRMERILRQSIRTLIYSEGEKNLLDIRRLLREAKYRTSVLKSIDDPDLVDFWMNDFPRMPASAIDPILNRLSPFFEDPLVRNVVVQPNLIDFYEVMNEGKILICNLSKGIIGEDAATLLGSFILSRLQLAAMARADVPEEKRRLFPILVDEFQNYAGVGMDNSSIRSFLTEARKMRVPLVLATQYMSQLDRDVIAAIFGTVSTFIILRSSPIDARSLQRELGEFTEEDILNLDRGQALVRMGMARDTFNVQIPLKSFPERDFRDLIVQQSHQRYCRHVTEVEKLLKRKAEPEATGERPWIVDGQGNVFTQDDLKQGRVPAPRPQRVQPAEAPHESVPEEVQTDTREVGQQKRQETSVSKELIEYLEHAASYPFMPVAERNDALNLSKFRSPNIRRQLEEAGWIRQHRVSTGRRSGQLLLVEVTEGGYEFLTSLKIRAQKPRGRGGFAHKYYAHKLKEYSKANWPGCTANIEDESRGRPADVTVRTPQGRNIAFEVFMTGESKEVKGIVQDVQLFDKVIACAPDAGSLESLKARVINTLDADSLKKVTFSLISQYLTTEEGTEKNTEIPTPATSKPRTSQPKKRPGKTADQVLIPPLELEKNRPELELEPERRTSTKRKRGRKPIVPLMKQVEEAYAHLHDLDWLQESGLTSQEGVRERVNPLQTMPEGQALRELLIQAARQVAKDMASVPDKSGVSAFLDGYLQGKSVTEIAEGLGVSREWVSRAYRREAFNLAGMQFVRMVSREDSAAK